MVVRNVHTNDLHFLVPNTQERGWVGGMSGNSDWVIFIGFAS